ncbi:GNAT family N-acetyltransferase [Sanguibacter sp. A247]|uniref:GNAT family N-acetyltransferase n=1 Tax=unclassified Sanguibacter TaxID=2645534 RepID=UPI003FD7D230
MTSALDSRDEEIIVVRFDASRRDIGAALARTGRVVLPAGTLTYWERPSSLGELEVPEHSLRVVEASEPGAPSEDELDLVVGDSFAAYGNHYSANPLLDAAAALAGYQEWARRSLETPDHEVAFLFDSDDLIGAATVHITPEHAEILLAGLIRAAQGRGAYRALLSWCVATAARHDVSKLIISTQADNVRVQRAWARAGFVPFAAVETAHLVREGLPE